MADDFVPVNRIVRWMLLGAIVLAAVGVYFRWGRGLPPIESAPSAESPVP